MTISEIIDRSFIRLADAMVKNRFQPAPSPSQLRKIKIISHRGEHDNLRIFENTLPAFDKATQAGVWGIELDVRWTRDLVPVVIHDPDLRRLYGVDHRIHEMNCEELHRRVPAIPTLSDVVIRFGGRVHLMIEIKPQPWLDLPRQNRILFDTLGPLEPVQDYHLISSRPEALVNLTQISPKALVAIAMRLPCNASRWVRRHNWGGLCGHYLLMGNALIRKHAQRGQCVGTGYADSRNCLFRELYRGINWIFSNKAAKMQSLLSAGTTDA